MFRVSESPWLAKFDRKLHFYVPTYAKSFRPVITVPPVRAYKIHQDA